MNLYDLFKNVAFKFDAELVHHNSLKLLSIAPWLSESFSSFTQDSQKYRLKCGGLDWSFPIGLAAGLDKNAEAIEFFSQLSFGGIEVGTVTPKPQEGNPKPRLFRILEESSLRNRMGFNNEGMDEVFNNIISSNRHGKSLGVNLGKNKITSDRQAVEDYCKLYNKFQDVADYLVINVSSPNTPGLRSLQRKDELKNIIDGLKPLREEKSVPLFVKISPDLAHEDVKDVVELAKECNLNGLIATNTSIMANYGEGGVSGKLIKERSRNMRNLVLEHINECRGDIELIGVGGISDFKDLWDFWKNGGSFIQIYTSFIFQGPAILHKFQSSIDKALMINHCATLDDLLANITNAKYPD